MSDEATTGTEAALRLKRCRLRAWRRGMKEVDLILGPWADALDTQTDLGRLDLFEQLLGENDQEIYRWISGQASSPALYTALIDEIRRFTTSRFGSKTSDCRA